MLIENEMRYEEEVNVGALQISYLAYQNFKWSDDEITFSLEILNVYRYRKSYNRNKYTTRAHSILVTECKDTTFTYMG